MRKGVCLRCSIWHPILDRGGCKETRIFCSGNLYEYRLLEHLTEGRAGGAALLGAGVSVSAFLRSFCEEGAEDLAHLSALTLRAPCTLGAVFGNPFGALEFSTALATSILVYWHESPPTQTAVLRKAR